MGRLAQTLTSSLLWQLLNRVTAELRQAAAGSRIGQLAPAVADERVGSVDRTRLTAGSRTARTVRGMVNTLSGVAGGSALVRSGTTVRGYVTGSFLYRWLTAEPEPDVIVIDLRETVTVGPWLAALERVVTWLLPAAVSSALFRGGQGLARVVGARPVQLVSLAVGGITAAVVVRTGLRGGLSAPTLVVAAVVLAGAAVGARVRWSLSELRDTRGYQAVVAAFEPPEPPESPATERGSDESGDPKRSEDRENS